MEAPSAEEPILDVALPAAASVSPVCRRGTALTIIDSEGGGNVSALLYRAGGELERYCMPDTLKAQHISRLTAGVALYSDMGRVLASIVEDSCGWHDTISGHATARIVATRWGADSYQQAGNEWRRSAREAFLVELAKYGLGARDLIANVNFFSKVAVDEQGALGFVAGHSPAGARVRLRFELDTLLVLWNGPHPMDPEWRPRHVRLILNTEEPAGPEDPVRMRCAENERGFAASEAALR
jgi:urea carboxylase-associated protein 2